MSNGLNDNPLHGLTAPPEKAGWHKSLRRAARRDDADVAVRTGQHAGCGANAGEAEHPLHHG